MALLIAGSLSGCSPAKQEEEKIVLPNMTITVPADGNGKFAENVTFKSPKGDTNMSLSVKEGGLPTINVKTPDGGVMNADMSGTGSVEWSSYFPLKQYPGSKVSQCTASPNPDQYVMASMDTTDPSSTVEKFYRDSLASDGWKIVSYIGKNKSNPMGIHCSLTANKDGREAQIMIMDPTGASKTTSISLTVSKIWVNPNQPHQRH